MPVLEPIKVVDQESAWDPKGVLVMRLLLENGDEASLMFSDGTVQTRYEHANHAARPRPSLEKRSNSKSAIHTQPPCPVCGQDHHPEGSN